MKSRLVKKNTGRQINKPNQNQKHFCLIFKVRKKSNEVKNSLIKMQKKDGKIQKG